MTAHLAHQLLHSDALAAELEALGLDSTLFGGVGVPAPIFQCFVPRRAGVFDQNAHTFGTASEPATFARASDASYLDALGKYQIAGNNALRADYAATGAFLGYLFEPGITNKCTNWNLVPDAGLTNISKQGDAAAVLSRVVASDLPAAFADIAPDGYVVQLDNSAGSTAAYAKVAGATANTNTHTWSAWAKKISGAGDVKIGNDPGTVVSAAIGTTWARTAIAGTPGGAAETLAVHVPAGCVAQFFLNQLEEHSLATTFIVTEGASGTRLVDGPVSFSTPADFSQDTGTIVLDWIPSFDHAELKSGSTRPIIRLDDDVAQSWKSELWHWINASGVSYFASRDEVGTIIKAEIGEEVAGTVYRVALRWSTVTNKFQVGFRTTGTWTWQQLAYGGTFPSDGTLRVQMFTDDADWPRGVWVKNVRLYNRDLTQSEIERLH